MRAPRLTDLQAVVGGWHIGRWGDPGPVTMAAKLAEEVGEVCEAAVKVAQGHPRADEMDYAGELADVVIVALAAASLANIDLSERIVQKLLAMNASPAALAEVRSQESARREVVLAAADYVNLRGWAVLDRDGRCHDCHASIDAPDHYDGCDYDRLRTAVAALSH